jgi:hypothetical protein
MQGRTPYGLVEQISNIGDFQKKVMQLSYFSSLITNNIFLHIIS